MKKKIKNGLKIIGGGWLVIMMIIFFTSGESQRMNENYMYTALETAMENPKISSLLESKNTRRHKQFPKGLNFVLETLSEKEEMLVDGNIRSLVNAQISRNNNVSFLLDVSDLPDYNYKTGSLLSVKSKYDCNITLSVDEISYEYIVLKASDVLEYVIDDNIELKVDDTYNVETSGKHGSMSIQSVLLDDTNTLHVFFKFKNKIPGVDYPFYTGMRFYQNGYELKIIENKKEYDNVFNPLDETVRTLQEKDYYLTLESLDDSYIINNEDSLEVVQYNDYFQKVQTSLHDIKETLH